MHAPMHAIAKAAGTHAKLSISMQLCMQLSHADRIWPQQAGRQAGEQACRQACRQAGMQLDLSRGSQYSDRPPARLYRCRPGAAIRRIATCSLEPCNRPPAPAARMQHHLQTSTRRTRASLKVPSMFESGPHARTTHLPVCMPACLLACLHVCLFACVPACTLASMQSIQ